MPPLKTWESVLMPDIVTLSEAKDHLRILHDDDDTNIELLIASATESVLDIASGWDGVGEVPARLKLAVLARVAHAFDDRGSVEAGRGEDRLVLPLRALDL